MFCKCGQEGRSKEWVQNFSADVYWKISTWYEEKQNEGYLRRSNSADSADSVTTVLGTGSTLLVKIIPMELIRLTAIKIIPSWKYLVFDRLNLLWAGGINTQNDFLYLHCELQFHSLLPREYYKALVCYLTYRLLVCMGSNFRGLNVRLAQSRQTKTASQDYLGTFYIRWASTNYCIRSYGNAVPVFKHITMETKRELDVKLYTFKTLALMAVDCRLPLLPLCSRGAKVRLRPVLIINPK
jgi:hypothetical protein